MSIAAFGQKVKSLRLKTGLTLREFCARNGMHPGNHSRLERGRMPPPTTVRTLSSLATALGLDDATTEEYNEFFDLAAACRGQVPVDLMEDEIVAKLPALYRAVRNDPTIIDRMVEAIRTN